MKKFLIQSVLLLLVITLALVFYGSGAFNNGTISFFSQKQATSKLTINGTTLTVEVADTQSKRSQGLGGRDSLGENQGMLFVFEKVGRYSFWMKGLKFPLDFVWIKGNTVVDISANIQPPTSGQSDASLPIYSPKEDVDKVLEINAGMIEKLNIKVGDTITLPR